jgi:hypothetical protein
MANRIVSWGGNEPIIPPNPSKTHSIVSADSILQDKHDTSPPVQPEGASYVAVSWAMNMAPQVIGSSGTETSTSTSTYPGANATDGSFTRHPKYFFKDGNVAFLVRVVRSCEWWDAESIDQSICRSRTRSIVFTGISSLATRYTSPPDSPTSTSVTTSPFLPSYHLETSNVTTLMPSSPSYIPSEISGPLFINLLI